MAMQGYATVSYSQITSYNKLFTQLHNGSQVEHQDLYQVCSNYAPGAKNDPTRGSYVLHYFI